MRNHVSTKSLVDKRLTIDKDQWVVSIVRKPEGTTNNPEHAFLILEGINNENKVFIKKYDLFIDENKQGYSKIEIAKVKGSPNDVKISFTILMDRYHQGIELRYKSWNIDKEQGKQLHQEILQDKQNPPKYRVSGDRNISGYSNTGSSQRGHSCFTWAREKLWNLDERMKKDLPSEYRDLIASITSRYIGPKEEAKGLTDFVREVSRG